MGEQVHIEQSIQVIKNNLDSVARVSEWADKMGYNCPKKFARTFIRHFGMRPQTCLKSIRLQNILSDLRTGKKSNFEIARMYGIPDEIALNKYINYHLDCSPSQVKRMPENLLKEKIEKLGSKVR